MELPLTASAVKFLFSSFSCFSKKVILGFLSLLVLLLKLLC